MDSDSQTMKPRMLATTLPRSKPLSNLANSISRHRENYCRGKRGDGALGNQLFRATCSHPQVGGSLAGSEGVRRIARKRLDHQLRQLCRLGRRRRQLSHEDLPALIAVGRFHFICIRIHFTTAITILASGSRPKKKQGCLSLKSRRRHAEGQSLCHTLSIRPRPTTLQAWALREAHSHW